MSSSGKISQKNQDFKNLTITNARENNLKSLTISLPHNTYIGITGVSGSGKSSLAFDTIYAEGQRRYIETFSPYTRQFFDKVKKPDVDLIENIRPAIAIQQRTRILNSRSTVGSLTDINDFLKILWANLSTAKCPTCKIDLQSWTPELLAKHILKIFALKPDTTYLITAQIKIAAAKKEAATQIDSFTKLGFARFYDPATGEIQKIEELDKKQQGKDIHIVLERIKDYKSTNLKRVQEAVKQSFSIARGICTIIEVTKKSKRLFINSSSSDSSCSNPKYNQSDNDEVNLSASDNYNSSYRTFSFTETPACTAQSLKFQRPRPSLFSYNHPIGACINCKGFGNYLTLDLDLVVPDPKKSLEQKCIVCWDTQSTKKEFKDLIKFCEKNNIATNIPWLLLPEDHKKLIVEAKNKEYWGIRAWFGWLEKKTYKMHVRVFLSKYRTQRVCPECNGTRLKKDALIYEIMGKTIADIWQMPISDLESWVQKINETYQLKRQVKDIVLALESRLRYLLDLGLSYLTLDRQARTLSGGETQRVNLASAIGSELVSTQFVLDEPSVGLHARDSECLTKSIEKLFARGNSVIAVEHDPDFIDSAGYVLELGPRAGIEGGNITYFGDAENWGGIEFSKDIIDKDKCLISNVEKSLEIKNATSRNLKNVSLSIPLSKFVCITGVSGSGKSTLVSEVILKEYELAKKTGTPSNIISGINNLNNLSLIDQSPLSKTPRANIATYTGIWDEVRDLFSASDGAKMRALSRSAFSFNVNAGRCTNCDGAGFIKEDMQFLSDVYIPCEVCLGLRFQQPVLEVKVNEKNVADLLKMSVKECGLFFENNSKISGIVNLLSKLGLDHLTLGHSLSELSGGEAQRLKLVPFIEKSSREKSLLIFDEPTTGLHIKDVEKLILLFRSLRDLGHSILCIEHNLTLILASDWIIDLGPEGGDAGGHIVLTGTPGFVLNYGDSYTAKYLKNYRDKFYEKKSHIKNSLKIKREYEQSTEIKISGARVHNLKNVSISVPLNKVVAFTGVSGSGKSSIAKDIIYAEGQRRYLDCLSPYARQFVKGLERPDIDHITNILPTICVEQHTFQPGSLSTVATVSESYNFLRLLYAKTGIPYCPAHPEQQIEAFSAVKIAEILKNLPAKNIRILAPIIKSKKGNHRSVIERAIESENSEIRVDGLISKPSSYMEGLEKSKVHSIEFVIAKFSPKNIDSEIIADAVSQALALGSGELIILSDLGEQIYSSERACPVCKRGFYKCDPEDLSFHSKRGRCKRCSGTGVFKESSCPDCGGTRLNEIGRNIKILDMNIAQLCDHSPQQVLQFLDKMRLSETSKIISQPILRELEAKLKTLLDMGLNHLKINRDCSTLSGGELQRLRLATAMGSPLSGVMYIFDEPSIGLHPFDNRKVIGKLHDLKEAGNSVIIIEHDKETIFSAEHIIEVGPGGGAQGGEIVFSGSKEKFKYGESNLEKYSSYKHSKEKGELKIINCSGNTIKNLNIDIPLKAFTCVCGLSGTGKSSLVHEIIYKTLVNGKKKDKFWSLGENNISSDVEIDRVLLVDQTPIGSTSRSTPASYLGIWDEFRKLYANTLEAKSNGWGPSHFSYNAGTGRCPECKGLGTIKLEMSFLSTAKVLCETCQGRRFKDETQLVLFADLSISDVLNLTFDEARDKFPHHRKIHQVVRLACELGLGYLTLGQSSNTLSGGEAQRLKLVTELSRRNNDHTLYILDEPTTGLHKKDVEKLILTLKSLVDSGNTVIVIEHDSDLLFSADHIIEMGNEAGDKGGKVVYQGGVSGVWTAKTAWGEWLRERGKIKNEVKIPPFTNYMCE